MHLEYTGSVASPHLLKVLLFSTLGSAKSHNSTEKLYRLQTDLFKYVSVEGCAFPSNCCCIYMTSLILDWKTVHLLMQTLGKVPIYFCLNSLIMSLHVSHAVNRTHFGSTEIIQEQVPMPSFIKLQNSLFRQE